MTAIEQSTLDREKRVAAEADPQKQLAEATQMVVWMQQRHPSNPFRVAQHLAEIVLRGEAALLDAEKEIQSLRMDLAKARLPKGI